ncbi:hypothetical protein FH972_023752 [Carpinus fangiana]|uniref:Cation efflux protein transmembrane domain-containing protein n=1 Tax=Carpinus fangiana TaxID=176857 RepID=A0A5N6KWC8_9ROSI|nr:hypothetical protein FH972_023752 [Carpinus fangiana]
MLLPRGAYARVPASLHHCRPLTRTPTALCASYLSSHQPRNRRTATLSASKSCAPAHLILHTLPQLALQRNRLGVTPSSFIMATTKQTQTRTHTGHSHNHHHHDNTFLTSTDKTDAGVRITRIGLYVNLGMAITKSFGGYYFNSRALLADGLHSLTDLVSDVITLATVSWSLKPPTARFPHAYGKIESLGSLGVSGILLAGGFLMGWDAVYALMNLYVPGFADFLHIFGLGSSGHGHGGAVDDMGPNINAAWLAAGSIAIKERLYHATLKVARERKSNVLASNAYHHRVDSLTALVALVMIIGSNFMTSAAWMDPVGGLVISLMVVQAGWGNTRDSLLELADVGVDEEMRNKVRAAATTALAAPAVAQLLAGPGGAEVRVVGGVKAGQSFLMDIELGVPAGLTVQDTQRVEHSVRDAVGASVRGVKRVRIRFVPRDAGEPALGDEFIDPLIAARGSPEPEEVPAPNGKAHKH